MAERWLCFFMRNGHSAESHSEGAAWNYIGALSEEDKRAYGTSSWTWLSRSHVSSHDSSHIALTWVVVRYVCLFEAGVLMVKQDNAEKKGKLFQCPGRITMSARNRVSKARGKHKGAAKDRTRDMTTSLNPAW